MAVTFDGASKQVILDDTSLSYTAQHIYSKWKEWAIQDANSMWTPAFETVGGDDLGGGQSVPDYYFLQNQAGSEWRLKMPEADIDINIEGNLQLKDPDADIFIRPVGFTPSVNINRTSVSSVDLSGIEANPLWPPLYEATISKPTEHFFIFPEQPIEEVSCEIYDNDDNLIATVVLPRRNSGYRFNYTFNTLGTYQLRVFLATGGELYGMLSVIEDQVATATSSAIVLR